MAPNSFLEEFLEQDDIFAEVDAILEDICIDTDDEDIVAGLSEGLQEDPTDAVEDDILSWLGSEDFVAEPWSSARTSPMTAEARAKHKAWPKKKKKRVKYGRKFVYEKKAEVARHRPRENKKFKKRS